MSAVDPATVIADLAPSIKGKSVIVTGASPGGIGAEIARLIAVNDAKRIVVHGRTLENANKSIQNIRREAPDVDLVPLAFDLSSFDSIRKAADEVLALPGHVDVLINNAGNVTEFRETVSTGLEAQLAVNYIGPWLFTNLVLPKLRETAKAAKAIRGPLPRIVNVASSGHYASPFRFDDPQFEKEPYDTWVAYGSTKTAVMLSSLELADRLNEDSILVFAPHPGLTYTNFNRSLSTEHMIKEGYFGPNGERITVAHIRGGYQIPFMTRTQAAVNVLAAAFDETIKDQSGSYLADGKIANDVAAPYARDKESARKLWTLTEGWVGQKFPFGE